MQGGFASTPRRSKKSRSHIRALSPLFLFFQEHTWDVGFGLAAETYQARWQRWAVNREKQQRKSLLLKRQRECRPGNHIGLTPALWPVLRGLAGKINISSSCLTDCRVMPANLQFCTFFLLLTAAHPLGNSPIWRATSPDICSFGESQETLGSAELHSYRGKHEKSIIC